MLVHGIKQQEFNMRIAVSGTASQGKTTFINDFIKRWPNYTTPDKTYRDIIGKKKKHSKRTTQKLQWDILNFMVDQLQEYKDGDHIILDRCPLDNLVYSLWAHGKDKKGFEKEYIDKCIPVVRESLRFLDIIFFTPITKVAPVRVESDDLRETNEDYIHEIDHLFKAISKSYYQATSPFFVKDDRPALIEIFGAPKERIMMTSMYLNETGNVYDEKDTLINPGDMDKLQSRVKGDGSDRFYV
jgi:predicted ATPase